MYMYIVLFLKVETDLESSSNLGCYDLSKNKTCKKQNICIFFWFNLWHCHLQYDVVKTRLSEWEQKQKNKPSNNKARNCALWLAWFSLSLLNNLVSDSHRTIIMLHRYSALLHILRYLLFLHPLILCETLSSLEVWYVLYNANKIMLQLAFVLYLEIIVKTTKRLKDLHFLQ